MPWSNSRNFPVEEGGSPVLTCAAKHAVVRDYATAYPDLQLFVETGIWDGQCAALDGVAELFAQTLVIDLDAENCRIVRQANPWIRVEQGDSGQVLARLLPEYDVPGLFWLDAHEVDPDNHPGSRSPLRDELAAILTWPHCLDSVVLIDDMRQMGSWDWPSIDELADTCEPVWDITVDADVMRCIPR